MGALGLKIEAYTADSRERERHLQDAVSLARLLEPGDLHRRPLHGSAPTRLRRFLWRLEGDAALSRAGISRDDAADAALAVEELLDLHGEGG